ncbi:MAG: outer membrane beta-barrel protein [Arenicellales bacterium]
MHMQTNVIRSNKVSLICAFTILQFFVVLSGHASPLDLKPYVSLGATSDSNLFRLSDDSAEALGATDLSEDYYRAAFGAVLDWQRQRQKLDIDAEINSNKFKRFDTLDYTGGHVKARWLWVLGNLWDGKASYNYNRTLKSFGNSLIPSRDIKTTNHLALDADRKINERWFARMGGYLKDVDFSDSPRNNKKEYNIKVGAFYKSHANNTTGIVLRVTEASFQDRGVNVARLIDDGFTTSSLDAVARWTLTGKSRISARLGYTKREQNNVSVNDFDGMTGRFIHYWALSKKTRIQSSIWRILSTLGDEIANYAVVTGAGVEADWRVANKTKMIGGLTFEQRDFQEAPELIGDGPFESRVDDVYRYWVGLVYSPMQNLSFDLIYKNGERDSNRVVRDYTYDSITANLKFNFN